MTNVTSYFDGISGFYFQCNQNVFGSPAELLKFYFLLIFHVCVCITLVINRSSMLKNIFRFEANYTTCLTNDKNMILNFGSINSKRLRDKINIQIKK